MEAMPVNPPAVAASGDSNASVIMDPPAVDEVIAGDNATACPVSVTRCFPPPKVYEPRIPKGKWNSVKRRGGQEACNECGMACIKEWSTACYLPLEEVFWSERVCCSEACMHSYLAAKCGSALCMDEPQVEAGTCGGRRGRRSQNQRQLREHRREAAASTAAADSSNQRELIKALNV